MFNIPSLRDHEETCEFFMVKMKVSAGQFLIKLQFKVKMPVYLEALTLKLILCTLLRSPIGFKVSP